MADFRIEDLFEPLNNDEPTQAPVSLDEAVEQYGFDDVYAALQQIITAEEEK